MTHTARHSPSSHQRLLAVGCGIVLALAAGEILLRVVGAPEVAPVRRGRFQLSANQRLVYEPVPGLTYEGAASQIFFEYSGTSNRLGYRDRDHTPAKPPGIYRIAVLGDSIAAGYRILRTKDVFPALLERHLREAGLPVEVLNFGVTGYNTEQEVETLRSRALAFAPDLVLVAYCHNDRRPPDPRIVQALREAEKGRLVLPLGQVERLLVHSALYRFVRYSVLDARREEAAPGAGDTVEPSLRELAKLSRREGFPVLLAVFPYLPKLYDREHAGQHVRLERLCHELGFHHLDLRPAFQRCGKAGGFEQLRFDRYHPRAAGHRCAAEAMAVAVQEIIGRRRGL